MKRLPYFGGFTGLPHANDFDVVDKYAAYVVPAKIAAAMEIDLLSDDAALARQVVASYVPAFDSKETYLTYASSLFLET